MNIRSIFLAYLALGLSANTASGAFCGIFLVRTDNFLGWDIRYTFDQSTIEAFHDLKTLKKAAQDLPQLYSYFPGYLPSLDHPRVFSPSDVVNAKRLLMYRIAIQFVEPTKNNFLLSTYAAAQALESQGFRFKIIQEPNYQVTIEILLKDDEVKNALPLDQPWSTHIWNAANEYSLRFKVDLWARNTFLGSYNPNDHAIALPPEFLFEYSVELLAVFFHEVEHAKKATPNFNGQAGNSPFIFDETYPYYGIAARSVISPLNVEGIHPKLKQLFRGRENYWDRSYESFQTFDEPWAAITSYFVIKKAKNESLPGDFSVFPMLSKIHEKDFIARLRARLIEGDEKLELRKIYLTSLRNLTWMRKLLNEWPTGKWSIEKDDLGILFLRIGYGNQIWFPQFLGGDPELPPQEAGDRIMKYLIYAIPFHERNARFAEAKLLELHP